MKKVQLVIENGFINSKFTSKDLGITVFDRVFHKLVFQGGPLGKILPIYLKIKNDYFTFGVITLNQNGSYSFFPELPGIYDYDHITFMKDLVQNKHHFTRVTGTKREKVLPLFAQHLTNNMYHAASFVYGDQALLKSGPRKVIYPEIAEGDIKEIQKSFVTNDKYEGSTVIELKGTDGAICIQFFLIPKGVDFRQMMPFVQALQNAQPGLVFEGKVDMLSTIIPHEYQDDYVLGLLTFVSKMVDNKQLAIIAAASASRFYSKLDVLHLKK